MSLDGSCTAEQRELEQRELLIGRARTAHDSQLPPHILSTDPALLFVAVISSEGHPRNLHAALVAMNHDKRAILRSQHPIFLFRFVCAAVLLPPSLVLGLFV